MGKMEKESRKRDLRKYILSAVALAGVLGIGLLAPNVLGAMAKMGILPGSRDRESIANSRKRLIKNGYLEYRKGLLRLTEKGEVFLHRIDFKNFRTRPQRRWDRKWRVLIFDIPESSKVLRDKVRSTLMAIGFIRLQDSVWIYPYDCEDLITLLKADFKIGKDLLYMIVESLEYDIHMRSRFGLE